MVKKMGWLSPGGFGILGDTYIVAVAIIESLSGLKLLRRAGPVHFPTSHEFTFDQNRRSTSP
jgi:hypothetical protein